MSDAVFDLDARYYDELAARHERLVEAARNALALLSEIDRLSTFGPHQNITREWLVWNRHEETRGALAAALAEKVEGGK